MAIKTILQQGDPTLGKKTHPVTRFDEKLGRLIDDMRDTLVDSGGLGLAAPQIGILRRVVLVVDDQDNILELVNPTIVEVGGTQCGLEGCLSLPGLYAQVTRPDFAKVRAQNRNGEYFETQGTGITARCFCHELDHLEGVLFDSLAESRLFTIEELDAMEEEG